jgi:Tfp pilus assembly protein PilF
MERVRQAASIRSFLGARPWLQAALLTAAGIAALSPSLDAGFVWDDLQQIVGSPTISDPAAPVRYFSLNVVESYGSEGRGAEGVDTYRPLFFVTLWLVHRINGADPFWFHLAVIAAHLGVCLLLWTAARGLVRSDLAAAFVFLAFAIHPVTAEAYLWASAISEPLAAAGLIGSALVLGRWCGSDRTNPVAAAAAGLAMLLGLLSKEAVLTALPVVSIYLWRVRGVNARALVAPWIAAAVFLALRVHALGGLQATGSGTAQRMEAIRNLPVLVLDGIRSMLALSPVGIRHLYWDYRGLTWTTSVIAAAVILVVAAAAWRARRSSPLTLVALGVTICMLVPVALVTTVPGWGGFGRYLYLPWGATALALAEIGRRSSQALAEHAPRVRWAVAAMAVIFLALEALGLGRAHEVYRSQESLARTSIELSPQAPDGWEWLGNHFVEIGDLPNAARCYSEAVTLAPELYRPRHNLAATLFHLGRPDEALAQERIVESQHGVTPDVALIAATACVEIGRWDEAGRWLLAGLDLDPENAQLRAVQARMLDEHPRPDDYRRWLDTQLAASPDRPASAVILPMLR